MMQMTPQQSSLPFDPYNPMAMMYTFTEINPPYVPRNHQLPQDLIGLLPIVSAAVASAATIKANTNPSRMFLFNQLSFNNYCNNDFESLVISVIELMCLRKFEGTVGNILQALDDAVDTIIQCKCIQNMFNFNELMTIVAQTLGNSFNMNNFQAFMADFSATASRINQMKQRLSQPQMQNQGGYPSPYNNNSNQFQQPHQNNQYVQYKQYQQQHDVSRQSNNGSLFSSVTPVHGSEHNSAHQHVDIAGKYGHLTRSQQSTPPVQAQNNHFQQMSPVSVPHQSQRNTTFQQVQQAPTVPQTNLAPNNKSNNTELHYKADREGLDYTVTGWVPTGSQPHPPAVDGRVDEAMIKVTVDPFTDKTEKIIVVTKIDDNERDKMERDKHTIIDMSLSTAVPPGFGSRVEAIDNTLKTVKAAEVVNIDNTVKVDNVWHARTFVEEAIFDTRLKQKQSEKVGVCTGYRSYNIIGIPIIGDKNRRSIIDSMSKKTKVAEVAAILRNILITPQKDNGILEFAISLDKLLAKKLTTSLRGKLSIGVSMDSFVEDSVEMFEYLKNEYGESYNIAYGNYQETFIKTFIKSLEASMEDDIIDIFSPKEEIPEELVPKPVNDVGITVLENLLSVTSIKVTSTELNLSLYDDPQYPGVGSLIEQHRLPALHEFATKVFKEERSLNFHIAHHLLVTMDDKIYELHKGIIGYDDNYLISKFVKS